MDKTIDMVSALTNITIYLSVLLDEVVIENQIAAECIRIWRKLIPSDL